MCASLLDMNQYNPEEMVAWDHHYVWHPFTQMKSWCENEETLVIARGEGCELIDIQGRRYLDGISALWVNVHGYDHPEINAAMHEQIDRLPHSTLLGQANVPSILLAKKLAEITPAGLEKVFFSDNGSTAVEVALKIAYQCRQQEGQTQRSKFLSFGDAYHGDTIGSVSVGGIGLFHAVYHPLLFERIEIPYPAEHKTCDDACLQPLREVFEKHGSELAAVIIEPLVQGASGMRLAPIGYLRELRALCDKHDVLLICDEVATGFGKTGTLFACEQEKVSPDLMCLAKGLTGGVLPVAATLATQRIYDAFYDEYASKKTFFHGHSFTGNPIGCAAALASIQILEREKMMEAMPGRIERLTKRLQAIASLKHVSEVRQRGFMVGIELMQNPANGEPYPYETRMGHRVIEEARKRGVIIRPLGDIVVLMPALAMTEEQLDRLVDVARESIVAATES